MRTIIGIILTPFAIVLGLVWAIIWLPINLVFGYKLNKIMEEPDIREPVLGEECDCVNWEPDQYKKSPRGTPFAECGVCEGTGIAVNVRVAQ